MNELLNNVSQWVKASKDWACWRYNRTYDFTFCFLIRQARSCHRRLLNFATGRHRQTKDLETTFRLKIAKPTWETTTTKSSTNDIISLVSQLMSWLGLEAMGSLLKSAGNETENLHRRRVYSADWLALTNRQQVNATKKHKALSNWLVTIVTRVAGCNFSVLLRQ